MVLKGVWNHGWCNKIKKLPNNGNNSRIIFSTDSSLAAAVATAPFDSRFGPRQRCHLIRAQLVSQLIRVQLVLLD